MPERRSSESSQRLSVKRSAKFISKSSKPSSKILTPPKAAIATPTANQDEGRTRNPFNDMLRSRGGRTASKEPAQSGPSHAHQPNGSVQPGRVPDMNTAHKVAELESALATAKEEQRILHEELENFKEQNKADQTTIESLKQELESHQHADDHTRKEAIQENHNLRHQLSQLQAHLPPQEEPPTPNHLLPSSHLQDELLTLRHLLHTTEKQSQQHLSHLLSLKSTISSLTRSSPQTSDTTLTDSISVLANRVREWAISNLRRTKITLGGLTKKSSEALKAICADYEKAITMDKIGFYQAIIGNAVTQILQESFIVGVSRVQNGCLAAVAQCARVMRETDGYNEWRRVTLLALEKSEMSHELCKCRDDAVHGIAADIAHLLFEMTGVNLMGSAQVSLEDILRSAAELQHLIVLQKARYHVLFFSNAGETACQFDDRTMEPVNDLDDVMDEDGDVPVKPTFLFCMFPCLEKSGDEWGEHRETNNVLFKARVCCGVG